MSSISLPVALWLAAGAASAVWLAAGWRWLARLLHMLQGGGYYAALLFPLAAPGWPTPPDRLHRGAALATAHRRSPVSVVAGLAAAAWSCRLGTRGSALADPVPGTPGQASTPLDEEGTGAGSAGLPPDPAGDGGTRSRRLSGGWPGRWRSGPEPGPWCWPGPAPGAAAGGDAHRVAGAGGRGGTALAGRAAQAGGQATLASSGSPAATARPAPRSS